jgi:signal transduction histidine kinase
MGVKNAVVLPTSRLWSVLAACAFASALTVVMALRTPWVGLVLQAQEDGKVNVLSARGPAAAIPPLATMLFLRAGDTQLELGKEDLMEEPDVVDDYVTMDAFFQRQSALTALLMQPALTVGWQSGPDSKVQTSTLTPRQRPLDSLPLVFWFQLAVSVTGCLIAAWVWALRPHEWGVRLFAITGASFPVFAMPAALYSSRELAMDGRWFRALCALNHWGSFMFGAALVALFLCSPQRLVKLRWVAAVFLFYNLWWLAETLRWAPDMDWGNRYAVMSEMLGALALAVLQWVRSRGELVERAALRWFMLSMLLGSGLFILLMVATASLGWLSPLPQGYAFGFFLVIYIGIALGLGRYRLFDLDRWAYRLLVWLGAAMAVLGLDALFALWFGWPSSSALALAAWIFTLVYLPLRNWSWQKFSRQHKLKLHELLPDVLGIALQPALPLRENLWDDLLKRLFQSLEQKTSSPAEPSASAGARIVENGLGLQIPACVGMQARELRYQAQGARLFAPGDCHFVDTLVLLMEQTESSLAAQERVVLQERQRIARDMHDDVGARLLMLIHRAKTPAEAELARAAMQDLRTALSALDTHSVPLAHALADWRAEASDRCEAAGLMLRWPVEPDLTNPWLSAHQKALLERAMRESITNALKHGQAQQIEIACLLQGQTVTLQISHDGPPTTPEHWTQGRGLRGMQHRLQEEGGTLVTEARAAGGTLTTICLPLGRGADHD